MTETGPDSVEAAEVASQVKAAYVHIPFCARLCPYCDFAVVTDRDDETGRYFAALSTELEREEPWGPLGSVYVGGGTPSRVDADLLGTVLDNLQRTHRWTVDPEISLEANPEDWSPRRAAAMRAAGFNRVSFGAQSFDPATLSRLGRRHTSSQIVEAVAVARHAGFRSVNLDLIYGSPGDDSWERTLHSALALDPDHLSCYALTVEPGTELFRQVTAGEPAPDPDLQADQWEIASALAGEAGLVRYEVSNWARPGHAVAYNLAVWAQAEYLAFGLGAHRFRSGVRSQNFRRLDSYLAAIESGRSSWVAEEAVDGWSREIERVFLGIRRTAGVVSGLAGDALLASEEGNKLVEHGVIERLEGRLIVRKPLLTDAVSRALLDLPPP